MADLYNSLLPTGNNILNKEEEEDKTNNLINNLPKDVSGAPDPDEFVGPEIKDEPVVPPLSKEEESPRPLVNQTEQLLSVVPPEEEKINSTDGSEKDGNVSNLTDEQMGNIIIDITGLSIEKFQAAMMEGKVSEADQQKLNDALEEATRGEEENARLLDDENIYTV